MASDSSVRVALRIRPQIAREIIGMCRVCTSTTPGVPQVWLGSDEAFTYDYVFDMGSTQEAIYRTCVNHLIEGCFEGYNATVFAYGQTGSGKTYTMGTGFDMELSSEQVGIIPRAMKHLFEGIDRRRADARIKGESAPEFKVTAQFLELYNEEIYDLLDSSQTPYRRGTRSNYRIHEDPVGGIYVAGVIKKPIASPDEALSLLRVGALARTTGSTQMNSQSSRSHAIFTICVMQQRVTKIQQANGETVDGEAPSIEGMSELETLTAKFHFVDLAGSERLKRTGATGSRAKEGISINCGLLALGNVISALGDTSKKSTFVPYRDSKLTRLLQDSLGGNSKTVMIACVSPSDQDFVETRSTMKYANRARNIKNKITVNQDKSSKTIALLRQQIQQLELELLEYKQGKRVITEDGSEAVNDMYHENMMLQSDSNNLRIRIKALQETVENLTQRNQQLMFERDQGLWMTDSSHDGASDMSQVVGQYLMEIETLRGKLIESESTCEQLRKTAFRGGRLSITAPPGMTRSSIGVADGESVKDMGLEPSIRMLLAEAKKEIEEKENLLRVRGSKTRISQEGDENENEDGDEAELADAEESSDSDNKESLLLESEEALAELTQEMSLKRQLIEQLELTQNKYMAMREQYESKLLQLKECIRQTEEERDRVLSTINVTSSESEEKVKKVKAEYEKKIEDLQRELKSMQKAKREHAKVTRENSQLGTQLKKLRNDLEQLKHTKVKLMSKIKEEAQRNKVLDQKRTKEISQLRKNFRIQENQITKLESEKRVREVVLKRKQEEVAALRKIVRGPMSEKASGRVAGKQQLANSVLASPKAMKSRWLQLEKGITEVALNKRTLSNLERDMERYLQDREQLRRRLELVSRKRDEEIMGSRDEDRIHDLEEEMENLNSHIAYINSNITDCQESISQLDRENLPDHTDLDGLLISLDDEARYLVEKLVSMAINQSFAASQNEAMFREKENELKQIMYDNRMKEELLEHLCQRQDDLRCFPKPADWDDIMEGKTDSEPEPEPLPQYDEVQQIRPKIRRKTATLEELLSQSKSNHPSPIMEEDENRNKSPPKARRVLTLDSLKMVQSAPDMHTSPVQDTRNRLFIPPSPKREKKMPSPHSQPLLMRQISGNSSSGETETATITISSSPSSPASMRRNENVFSRLSVMPKRPESHRERGTIKSVGQRSGRLSNWPLIPTHKATGHTKAVLSVFATENLLFSASKDRTVKVWDLNTGQEISTLGIHPNNVVKVKYTEDKNLAFTASASYISVWDLRLGPFQCIKTLTSSGMAQTGPLHLATPSRIAQMPAGEHPINDISIGAGGNCLFAASSDKVRVWDLRRFEAYGKLSGGHQAAVMCLAALDDSSGKVTIATGSKDHTIKVFEVPKNCSGMVTPTLNLQPPHYDGIQCLALQDNILFSGSRDKSIKKWDLSLGQPVQSLNNVHPDWVMGLTFAPPFPLLLSCCRGGNIRVWNVDTCDLLGDMKGHESPINAITTNSSCIFTASNDCSVMLWRLRDSMASEEGSDCSEST